MIQIQDGSIISFSARKSFGKRSVFGPRDRHGTCRRVVSQSCADGRESNEKTQRVSLVTSLPSELFCFDFVDGQPHIINSLGSTDNSINRDVCLIQIQ